MTIVTVEDKDKALSVVRRLMYDFDICLDEIYGEDKE